MDEPKTTQARLLPKELWSQCTEYEGTIPEFEFSETFKAHLDQMISRRERAEIMNELRRASGCDFATAKCWMLHKTFTIVPKPKSYCPDCGARLRTAKAKQCWKCKRDWH